MTIAEMNQRIAELRSANKNLVETAKKESRKLTDEEVNQFNSNELEALNLRNAIAAAEDELRNNTTVKTPTLKELDIRSAILDAVGQGRRSEIAVRLEQRAALNTGDATGKVIDTTVMDILAPLRNRMVLGQAGATYLTGLTGNVKLPSYTGVQASWENENDAAAEQKGSFKVVELTPKRLAINVPVSMTLLHQDTHGVNEIIKQDMVDKISEKLEATLLGSGAGDSKTPAGIFNGKAATKDFGFDTLVDMETAADTNNANIDGAKYIMNTALFGEGKKTLANDGVAGHIIEGGEANGYGVLRTNNVVEKGVAFGDFSELFIGIWNNATITVDPYTQADKNIVRLILNVDIDAAVRNDKAIVAEIFD